jgi:hypothetical protein
VEEIADQTLVGRGFAGLVTKNGDETARSCVAQFFSNGWFFVCVTRLLEKGDFQMKRMAIGLLIALALIGCATIDKRNTLDQEQTLAAAGFKMKPADTPEKRQHLLVLPQQQIIYHEREGKVLYLFADATICKCLYVGSQKAYYRYQQLTQERQLAYEQSIAGTMNPDMGLDWGMWGAGDVFGPTD